MVGFNLPQDGQPGVTWLPGSPTGITGSFQVAGAPGEAAGALIENISLSTENPSAFQQPPPVATTNLATNITASSAALNGSVNPSGSTTTVYFQYGTTTSYGQTTPMHS